MSKNAYMPNDSHDIAVIEHRVTALESGLGSDRRVLYEVRDAVRDIALKIEIQKTQYCPAPGKCLELEKEMEALQSQINSAHASARTTAWIAKAFAGVIGVAATIATFWKK